MIQRHQNQKFHILANNSKPLSKTEEFALMYQYASAYLRPKMNRNEAHNKWGHPHYDQMNMMANQFQIKLMGKLNSCSGCILIKSRAKTTTITLILPNGIELKVRFKLCDNAGEHQTQLKTYCCEKGITLEYTAPNSPKHNGRAENKIHIIWQQTMTVITNANVSQESQGKFWAEPVVFANNFEDLIIK